MLCTFFASQAHASDKQDIGPLLNQGRGLDAKKIALTLLEESKDKAEKVQNAHLLLDVCMFISDNECFRFYWDLHWKELFDQLNSMPRASAEQENLWHAQADHVTAKHVYNLTLFPNENFVKRQLVYVKDRVIGGSQFESASLRTVLEARAAAAIGDRALARKLLRRARALVLARSLNNFTEQLTLAYCVETSVYSLFDTQEIRRFVKSFLLASEETGIDVNTFVNPYIAVRIYRAIYESGILNSQGKSAYANYLHSLYQNLQFAPSSTLQAQKESFYAYLELDRSWGNNLNINFNSELEFAKIVKPSNFDAIGVKAYLNSIGSNARDEEHKQLDETLKWLKIAVNVEESNQKIYKQTQQFFLSLKYRLQGDVKSEKKYLKSWAEIMLATFKHGGFSLLDQPPALSGLTSKLLRYAVQRLIEIEPNSEILRRLTYFSIVTFNASKDGDAAIAYSLLRASESDLEAQQIQDRIRLNANYSRKISDAYYKAAKHILLNKKKENYDGGVGLLDTYQLLEKLNTSDQQLARFVNTANPFVDLDYKTLIPKEADTSVILSAEADGYVLTLILKKDSSQVVLAPTSTNESWLSSKSVLTSQNLNSVSKEKIKLASIQFSKKIFGDSMGFGSHIQILSGPTFMGVPYTLLSDPSSGKWLIERAIVESYLSPQQREIGNRPLQVKRPVDYIAFANPVLRSNKEQATVESVAGMIRGTNGDVTSLPELPETEVESIEFSRAFEGQKLLYFGKDASAENLVALNLNNVHVLSFSTHGVLAGEIDGVKSSAIVLSPTKNNNGLISTDWLFSVTGAPNLAILSTCNSGTTAMPLDSSELTSLASVFLLKGSDAVISSYWQVDSQGTAELMQRLSREMRKTSSYSTALSTTIRALQAHPKWGHPSIWAAFVMVGNHKKNEVANVINDDIRLEINASVRYVYEKKNSTVLIGFENETDGAWTIAETQIELQTKQPYSSVKKGRVYQRVSEVAVSGANFYGAIAAVQNVDGWTFSEITESGEFRKICTLERVAKDWLIGDFFRTSTHIYSLFRRPSDDGVEVALASISIKDCSSTIKGAFPLKTGVDGYANLRLFPLAGGKEIVFWVGVPNSEKANTFPGPITELGVAPVCGYHTINTYFVLDAGLMMKSEGMTNYANMKIDSIRLAGSEIGVLGLWSDACTGKVVPRFLSSEFFKLEKHLDRERVLEKSDRFGVEIEQLVTQNFEYVSRLWWRPEAEYLFVEGSPIYTAGFFGHVTKKTVGNDAFYEWLLGLPNVYSYSFRTKKWRRISTSDECKFPQPLGYSKGSFFLCNELVPSKNKRTIHLKRIH